MDLIFFRFLLPSWSWQTFGYSDSDYSACVAMLFVLGLIFRGLAFFALLFKNRAKQQ